MYLLQLEREFLLIDEALWNRLVKFDAVSRKALTDIKVRSLTREQEDLLVELELFQVSETLSALVTGVSQEISERLNLAISRLSGMVSGKVQAANIPALLAQYRRLAGRFTEVVKSALAQRRNDELTAEAERIREEMDSIFATISEIIKASYRSLGITISDEDIRAMVEGNRDDLLAKYTELLR
jgi:hypothetical protein